MEARGSWVQGQPRESYWDPTRKTKKQTNNKGCWHGSSGKSSCLDCPSLIGFNWQSAKNKTKFYMCFSRQKLKIHTSVLCKAIQHMLVMKAVSREWQRFEYWISLYYSISGISFLRRSWEETGKIKAYGSLA
jgi:hypothetical protein